MNPFLQTSRLKTMALILLGGLMILLAGSLINSHSTSPSVAQNGDLRTLTVTGTGKIAIKTTLTDVRLGVEVEEETAREAQEEVARRSTAVVELLQEREVEKLETTGIRLQPRYRHSDGERRLIGYQGVNLVSFQMETEEIGNLLDQAVNVGATRIDSVGFTATESAIAQAKKEALEEATLDAKAQADAVLGSLDLRSQSVIKIEVDGAQTPVTPRLETARAQDMATSSAPSSPVVGGEQEIQARVKLQISY
ncbi:MAG: SIMPL domain-containing protein [Halothece sp.]